MADVDAFDLESDLPKFLESVLQKAETILQNVEDQPREIQPFTNVVALFRNHISSIVVTPTTLAASSVTIKKNKSVKPGRPSFEIPVEMFE
ncbi:unnamed protein product [Porites lobata]|uniref:Uncharacterized protein n=1 Tax=Porites lobata TaxID=104759 RepID=A0ABN8N7X6_9CNID|nr:unnamed protein product [Porites lobata]